MKMNPVVHFEMPAKDKSCIRKFYETATQVFLSMKKFDIVKLKKAYKEGEGTWQNM